MPIVMFENQDMPAWKVGKGNHQKVQLFLHRKNFNSVII